MVYRVEEHYSERFGSKPEVMIQSPGRINVIGEHTDYNLGYVLPAAINYYMFVAIGRNDSNKVVLHSIDYGEDAEIDLENVTRTETGWLNLIAGVVDQLNERIGGFDLAFGGNIPEGAGVSSSAALCCGVAFALSELYGLELDKWEIAKIGQKSEHNFALVQCGIMDQFACMFGLTNHVLLLDCKTYEYEESEVDISGFRFLLVNSNVKHSLGDSDYNKRKEESFEALEKIKSSHSGVNSYQDVTTFILENIANELDTTIWKRAFHVVTENERVFLMKDALKSKDHTKVGELLTSGHASLKDYYEVTCDETDFLVDQLNSQDNVFGARQVGGGFGGCVLALVKDVDIPDMLKPIESAYKKRFNLKLDNIPIKISRGCSRMV